MKDKRIIYYSSFDEDIIENKNQNYTLPKDYRWIDDRLPRRILAKVTYGAALVLGWIYFKHAFGGRIVGRERLKGQKGGCFIYCNHTQPIGDVMFPGFAVFPRRMYTVVSPANLGIPVIGKLLPALGALPTASDLREQREMREAIRTRIEQGRCICIYPEAHLWQWYTQIRPFASAAFHFPVELDVPCYTMVTAYSERKHHKRPRITLYVDGPFYPDESYGKRERRRELEERVRKSMEKMAQNSTLEYIRYEKKENVAN